MNNGETLAVEEKISALKEKVTAHSKKMRVKADSTRTKCVDGGYRAGEAEGAIAIPGGHLGISMALLNLGFSPEDSFNHVYNFTKSEGNPYCWHSDTHEGHDGCVVGCGHCNAAIGAGEHYGAEGQDTQALLNIVNNAQSSEESENTMEKVVLNRDHSEEAILVITSTDFTVKPWDEENDVQFFIYDKVRHLDLLKRFAEYLHKLGLETTYEQLVAASDEQTNSTLGLLGSSKGKPMFTVDASDAEKPVVDHVGEAPVI